MKIMAIFRTEKDSMILGGKVIEGEIGSNAEKIKVIRGDKIAGEGKLLSIESAKQKVNNCVSGQECGIKYTGDSIIEEGDVLEFYAKKEI